MPAPSSSPPSFFSRLLGRGNPALYSDRHRVVINALHAKSGGGVTYLRNLLPLLAEDERLELHVFLHSTQMDLFHPLDERVVVHVFDFPVGLAGLMFWEQAILPFMTSVMSADLVFSPANFGSIAVRDQVILLRNALAVAKTETRFSKRVYWGLLAVITFMSLIRARRVIAVSKYAAHSLSLGFMRVFRHKMRVVHHGVDPIFTPADPTGRENFLLAVSDIYVQKNLTNLFLAMKRVRAVHPDIKLLIAGQKIDDWYFNKITDLAAELGIAGNIEFLGRLNSAKLCSLYQRCKLFVFASTAETFGMPLVEAMACGTAITCSNSTAMPEIVGDAALVFDPMDPDQIAESILRLMADDALRQDLGQRAVAQAARFSWRKTASSTADVLAEAGRRR